VSRLEDRIALAQSLERERLARTPRRCWECGEYLEIDRNEQASVCLRCLAPSHVAQFAGEFVNPGVWQIGPVTFDWSGAVSVANCSACFFAVLRFDERCHRTAINHAKHWHGVKAKPHRVLAHMHVADCARSGCASIVATSEDLPGVLCAEHRDPERRAA
jgi:hypothetical protein